MISKFTLDKIIKEYRGYSNIERLLKNIEYIGINEDKYSEIWVYPKNLYNAKNDKVSEKEIHFYLACNETFYDLYFNKENSYKVHMDCFKLNEVKEFSLVQDLEKQNVSLIIKFKNDKIITMESSTETTSIKLTELYIESIKNLFKTLS